MMQRLSNRSAKDDTLKGGMYGFRRHQSSRHGSGPRCGRPIAEFIRAISFQPCHALVAFRRCAFRRAEHPPDSELLAVAAVLHDLGLTDRYAAESRFEVDGANAARAFLMGRGISAPQIQLVWAAIALHTTPTLALHKEPEVVMTHSGIAVDVVGAGLDRIPQD